MKAKELKVGIVLGLILLLGLSDFAAATTIEDDWWNESSILCDNSNSMVIDDIEYYIQTDKSTYNLGKNVDMLFRVSNLGDSDVLIPCTKAPEFNLLVKKDENTIWMKVKAWYLYSPGVEILSGESVDTIFSWDMKDDNGILVVPGIYNVEGVMYNSLTEVSVPITVIPEPGSIVLLMTGSFVLIRKKRGKRI